MEGKVCANLRLGPDRDPDHHQNLITSSFYHPGPPNKTKQIIYMGEIPLTLCTLFIQVLYCNDCLISGVIIKLLEKLLAYFKRSLWHAMFCHDLETIGSNPGLGQT